MATTKSTTNTTVKRTTTPKTSPATTETGSAVEKTAAIKPVAIDPNSYVTVRNGFQGRLVYKSTRTGEKFVWDEFGAPQMMELRELIQAKNTNKSMFVNNWFMFDEDWIPDYLGVVDFYKNAIPIDNFDDLLTTPSDKLGELRSKIAKLSVGQKASVAYRARVLIEDGRIDSRKAISALEELLGEQLISRDEN